MTKKFLLVITYNVQWIDHLGLFYFTVNISLWFIYLISHELKKL